MHNYIYYYRNGKLGWGAGNSDTFSPYTIIIGLLDFKISGKTYRERQASLEELAKDWQNNFQDYSWSWGELSEIQTYFYDNAKRYGLLREFKENCIC